MDLSNPENISIKREPASHEGGEGEVLYTNIENRLPVVKKECLHYVDGVQSTSKLQCVFH